MRRCLMCRMMFLDPYPDATQLERLYSEGYFTGANADGLPVPGSDAEYAEFAQFRLPKFQATVDLIQGFVPAPANLLDIGSATGEFLNIARRSGYRVTGIELSAFAAEQARQRFGLEIFVGALEAYKTDMSFDVIHLSHVLEHLVDPHRAIDRLKKILSARGVVYVEVPFQWNLVERLHFLASERRPFNTFSLHHRLFFRPSTLRALFARHGFVCRHLTLTPPHRYPVGSPKTRLKRALWQGLSWVGQGLVIEAVFSLDDSRSAPPGDTRGE